MLSKLKGKLNNIPTNSLDIPITASVIEHLIKIKLGLPDVKVIIQEFDGYESTLDSPAFDIKNIDSRFLLEYITRKEFYLKYGSQANGSRRARRIPPEVFFKMPIYVPSIEEQNKIGSFLDLLGQKIEKEKEKLMGLKEQKKAFMQEIFI